jgi:hypothetical protein
MVSSRLFGVGNSEDTRKPFAENQATNNQVKIKANITHNIPKDECDLSSFAYADLACVANLTKT